MKTEHHNPTHFWSGFAAGTLAGTVIMYLVGTARGREVLKKILNHGENFEEGVQDVLKYLQEIYELSSSEDSKEIKTEQIASTLNEVIEKVQDKVQDLEKTKKS